MKRPGASEVETGPERQGAGPELWGLSENWQTMKITSDHYQPYILAQFPSQLPHRQVLEKVGQRPGKSGWGVRERRKS